MYTLTRHFVTEDGTQEIWRGRYQSFVRAQEDYELAVHMINGWYAEELATMGFGTPKSVTLVGEGDELIDKYE